MRNIFAGSHIELCWTFSDNRFFSYCSFHYGSSNRATIFVWDHANFIQHLAKAILARSPCQAGLMIIAICLEAAAAVATAAAQFSENKSLEKMPDATTYQHPVGHSTSDARDGNTHWVSSSMDGAGPQQKAEVLLKDLKVVIDKSKCHFNQNTDPKVNCGFEWIQEFYQRVVGQ